MVVELTVQEKNLLINHLEDMILPELRCQIGSGIRKDLRDVLKKEKEILINIIEKLKTVE
jgi:hypothetical protein